VFDIALSHIILFRINDPTHKKVGPFQRPPATGWKQQLNEVPMKRISYLLIIAVVCFSVQACSKSKSSGGEIIIDGKKIDLPYAYAVKQNESYRVILLNHDKVTDEQMRDLFREVPEDEMSITIFSDSDPLSSSIIADDYRQMGINVKLESAPKKPGDDIVVTVPEKVTFKPFTGKFKDKDVSVQGTFTAKYCGETK
jgi:hypothetical protein